MLSAVLLDAQAYQTSRSSVTAGDISISLRMLVLARKMLI